MVKFRPPPIDAVELNAISDTLVSTQNEIISNPVPQVFVWELLASYTTRGSYSWTAPDLFNGNPYTVGALIIGGGGSGGAGACGGGNSYQTVSSTGGGSGYSVYLTKQITPNTSYSIVVGSGGSSVSAHRSSGNTRGDAINGKPGSSSSAFGSTASGGTEGKATFSSLDGSPGGQPSYNSNSEFKSGYGGEVIYGITTSRFVWKPLCCYNPFEQKRILASGGSAYAIFESAGSSTITGGINPVTGEVAGGSGVSDGTSTARASSGKEPGSGGGGAATGSSTGSYAYSGAGADGAVYIYIPKTIRP